MAGQIQGLDGLDVLQRSGGALQGVGKAADTKDKRDESAPAAGPAFTPTSSASPSAALTTVSRRLLLDMDQASMHRVPPPNGCLTRGVNPASPAHLTGGAIRANTNEFITIDYI